MFVIKVRAEGKKQFNFLTSDGGETRLRVHAAQVDDASRALSIAAEIRAANPEFESMVVDFNTGKTITPEMVAALAEAGEIAADNAEAEAAAAEFDALPQEEKDAMPIVDVFAEAERGMAQEEADDAANGTGADRAVELIDVQLPAHRTLCAVCVDRTADSDGYCEPCRNEAKAAAAKPEPIIMVTCAETAYDGFGTETVEVLPYLPNATSRNQYRSVAILPGALDWQTNRYASGMVSAMTPERFAELIELGIAVPVAAPKGWDESATGATDSDPKEEPASAAPASDGGQPDATPTPAPAAPPEGSPEAGEVFHVGGPLGGTSTDAHVVAEVGEPVPGELHFGTVCGRVFRLGEPATPLSNICDYCFMGVPAPADEPEAAKPATTRGAARTPAVEVEPQFTEEIDGLHLATLKLAGLIAEAGSRVDGVRLLSNLRVALASVQASLPKASRSRTASTGERSTYIRLAESGAKGATVNGQHFDSMADACRSAANLYPGATAAQSYVTRRAAGQTANARDYLKRDLAAGRIPSDAVSFDDEPAETDSDQAAA